MKLLPKTPFSSSNHYGISLHSNAIRAAAINDRGALMNSAEVIFPQPIIGDQVNNIGSFVEALKNIKQQGKFTTDYAAVCIPEKYAFSRKHTLPNLDFSEIGEAISWQIEKIFPFSKNEIYFDWKLLSQEEDQTHVLVTAIQKKLLDQIKSGFQAANIYPISFEPSASALSRLIPSQDEKALIILELDNFGTAATLVVEDVALLTTTTIIDRDSPPDRVLANIIQSIQSLQHQKTVNPSSQKLTMVLTGEKASPQLANLLTQQLNLPTKVFEANSVDSSYHLAYIAASAHILPPSSEQSINLLPTNLQDYYKAQLDYTLAKSTVKIVTALIIPALLISGLGYATTKLLTSQVDNQIVSAQQIIGVNGEGVINIAQVNQKAQRLIRLFPVKTTPENSLQTLITNLPPGISITNVVYEPATQLYSITGIAKSRSTMLDLKSSLEETGEFEKIILPLSALEAVNNFGFTLDIQQKIKTP